MIDFERVAKEVVASAFDDDRVPEPGGVHVRMTPAGKRKLKTWLQQSCRQHREFGGYVSGTVSGGSVSFDDFTHEVTGNDMHVTIPWLDEDDTVAGWHSHPDQYEGSGKVPETEDNGDPKPSSNDLRSFDEAKKHGHLSLIAGNGRYVVYDGRRKIHSEAL